MNALAHVEMNVADIQKTKEFYDMFLTPLGRTGFVIDDSVIGYKAHDQTHLFFVQADKEYIDAGFHRKQIGLNHLAFRVESVQAVDEMATYLTSKNLTLLYSARSRDYTEEYGMKKYYAIFCEDPDRIKVEVVYCV